MKKFYLLPFLFFASCLSEENVDLGTSDTFIRYFNGGANDVAVALSETSDQGFIILANSELEDGRTKIKLIKTDAAGNKEWSRVYPESDPDQNLNRNGRGLLLTADGGYVITGADIDPSGKSQLYVLFVNAGGQMTSEKIYPTTESIEGIALLENKVTTPSYLVLANVLDSDENNMYVAQINKSDLSIAWTRSYGSGEATNLVNKIYLDTNNKLIWGGTVTRQDLADVRLVRAIQDRQNTDFDMPIGKPDKNEEGKDLCRFGFGYAVTGLTDDTTTGEDNIIVQRLAEDGTILFSFQYPVTTVFEGQEVNVPGDKEGNAITATHDGGLFIAGTVESDPGTGFGEGDTDYYLIKTNGNGAVMWQKPIGSRFEDVSVAVVQASDGSLILCGTTELANLKSVMLMKMKADGSLE